MSLPCPESPAAVMGGARSWTLAIWPPQDRAVLSREGGQYTFETVHVATFKKIMVKYTCSMKLTIRPFQSVCFGVLM